MIVEIGHMKIDTVLNLTVVIVISLTIGMLILIARYNSSQKIEKISIVYEELNIISNTIREYYDKYHTYPSSLKEKKIKALLGNLSNIDPFDPGKRGYKYKLISEGWKVYSVGPNKIDDGGIAQNKKMLDIVVEGRIKNETRENGTVGHK